MQDLTKLSTEQLESIAYKNIKQIQGLKLGLEAIEKELASRLQANPKTMEEDKIPEEVEATPEEEVVDTPTEEVVEEVTE